MSFCSRMKCEDEVRACALRQRSPGGCNILLLCTMLLPLALGCETPLTADEASISQHDVLAPLADAKGSSALNRDIAALRAATAPFHRTEAAQAADYDLVDGLDHCFTNQPIGDMGYHYIDVGRLDLNVELLHPEAMVYVPGPNGQRMLGGVEYIVPAEAWDAVHANLPTLFGHEFHLNEALGVYVLHAWIWRHNPLGMFEDWNPTVTCD